MREDNMGLGPSKVLGPFRAPLVVDNHGKCGPVGYNYVGFVDQPIERPLALHRLEYS